MAFEYTNQLYAVGVGDFIAFKNGQFAAMGKACTETSFEVTASNLDIRGGKRAPMLYRYTHSSQPTFNIIAADYNPNIWKASMGGSDISYANLPKEETLTMAGRTLTLSETPVAVGDIPSNVWIKYQGRMYSPMAASSKTITIPSAGQYTSIPDNSTVCVIYNYKNINASGITIPANIQPDIWHIFIDVDLATDKSGAGIVGRTVVEIPLGQLDPNQTFNATMDGYSSSNVTGIMLADKTGIGCSGAGVYAYLYTEIFSDKWYNSVVSIVNDPDDVEIETNATYAISLLGLQTGGTYIPLDKDYYGDLTFDFQAGTATGSSFDDATGVITAGSQAGSATLKVTITNKPTVTYTMEVTIGDGE